MISNDKVRRMATTQSNRRGKRKRRNRLNQCLFPIESVSTTSSPCAPHVQSNMAGKRKRPLAAKCSAPHRNLHRHREIPLAKREPGESERNLGPATKKGEKERERERKGFTRAQQLLPGPPDVVPDISHINIPIANTRPTEYLRRPRPDNRRTTT